jgi:hypothetical protein
MKPLGSENSSRHGLTRSPHDQETNVNSVALVTRKEQQENNIAVKARRHAVASVDLRIFAVYTRAMKQH